VPSHVCSGVSPGYGAAPVINITRARTTCSLAILTPRAPDPTTSQYHQRQGRIVSDAFLKAARLSYTPHGQVSRTAYLLILPPQRAHASEVCDLAPFLYVWRVVWRSVWCPLVPTTTSQGAI
jgi:hypothetical protein